MAIDRMDWHYGADNFPQNAPQENAGVHIGFFLAWAFEMGMAGELHTEDEPQAIEQLAKREITGVNFLVDYCDEKLWHEDFNAIGVAFAQDYYENQDSDFAQQYGNYLDDFAGVFDEYEAYHVPNDWACYDKIKPLLNQRFQEWQNFQAA